MDQARDDALFEALRQKKRRKKRRIIRTVVIVLLLVAAGLTGGVLYLRRQVTKRFASSDEEVLTAQAEIGSISTQVSGSGTLLNVDEESLSIPAGVTVEELLVSVNDTVTEGQLLARIDTASVLAAMSSAQTELSSLDSEITAASGDAVSSVIKAGVAGRVKQVFAEQGEDVAACMYDHGALAVLSLDGYLYVEIPADRLSAGDTVSVAREGGKLLDGSVESVTNGAAVILVSDNGPLVGESVSVLGADGSELGSGTLAIHSPMRVTGITGCINRVYAAENTQFTAGDTLFSLTDTAYTARYQTLLRERKTVEDRLLELMAYYRSGGVYAPYAGTVSSVDYSESAVSADSETALVTLSPDRQMKVTLNVDESNILSLQLGQTASVTVSSIGDEVYTGSVTEINKTASSASGVTRYSAIVTLDKAPDMLQGMSAKVVIRIQGVDNAVLIPVDALHQTSATSFVYTSYDEETQEYGGLREVTVGITNSSYAEITSGLEAGETVYYTKTETGFSFPGGDFGGFGGGMASGGFGGGDFGGGNMPSGFGGGDFGGSRPSGSGSSSRPSGGGFPGGSSGRPGN